MRNALTLALAGFLWIPNLFAEEATPKADDYLGRWNIRILESNDTFPSAWLKLEKVDGSLRGSLLWKWGSPGRIRDISIQEGELSFRRGRENFRVQLAGKEIHGFLDGGSGKKLNFVGWPSPELCDVSGTWNVTPQDQPSQVATLVLRDRDGTITGEAKDPEGYSYKIKEANLEGHVLKFNAVPEGFETAPRKVSCEVRGDLMVGKVTVPSQEGGEREIPIHGKRERAWGEPVMLLKEQGTEGWGPRDPKRKFGWKVENGVLENSPPDVDIVSEKKFQDFRLHLEYKVAPTKNSGIYLRGQYELQILGNPNTEPHGNMAIYGRLEPKKNPMKPLDEWQTVDVMLIARWLTVMLNGETVHDNEYLEGPTGGGIQPKEDEPGPLVLQGDHGKIQFRNITVTPAK